MQGGRKTRSWVSFSSRAEDSRAASKGLGCSLRSFSCSQTYARVVEVDVLSNRVQTLEAQLQS